MSRIIKSKVDATLQTKRSIAIKPLWNKTNNWMDVEPAVDELETAQQLAEDRLLEMENQAQDMMARAELQSEQLTELFERKEKEMALQAEQLFEEHRAKGYEAGYQEGEQAAWATYSDKIIEAQSVIEQATREKVQKLKGAEPEMIQLACAIAKKILGKEITSDETLLQFLKGQVLEARDHNDIQLFVHPTWYEKVIHQKHELLTVLPPGSDFSLVPDLTLQENACRIETKQGRLTTSIDQQLEELKGQLLKLQEEHSHDQSSAS
ncbi:flagellar assembly protein FliH [Alkalihalobacillus sp. NPDC078783]